MIASAVLCSVVDRYAVERKQYSWLNESSTIQGLLDGGEFRQTVYALDRTLGSASCQFLRKTAGEQHSSIRSVHNGQTNVISGTPNAITITDSGRPNFQ